MLVMQASHLLFVKDVVEEVEVSTVIKFVYMMNRRAAVSPR